MAQVIALIDTNVLIRFLANDKSPKYHALYSFFESLEQGKIRVELKLIVLFQTLFVLKSYYQVPKDQLIACLQSVIQFKGIFIKDKKIVKRMLDLWLHNKIEIVDCYLIACMEADEQNILYSYDRDFDKHDIQRKEP